MAFSGTLKEFKVPDILQLLSMQSKTGILTFNSQDGFISIIFFDGTIVGVETFPKKLETRVGHVLVKQELISQEMLQRALGIQKRTGQKVGEILMSMGLVNENVVSEALRTQAVQILMSLFTWKKGQYNFKVERISEEMRSLAPLAVDNLIMEGVQMLDEWPLIKKVIPNADVVFEPISIQNKKIEVSKEFEDEKTGDENTIVVSNLELILLKYIDGKNSVRDLVDKGEFAEYKILKSLYNLHNKSLIRIKQKARPLDVSQDLELAVIAETNTERIKMGYIFLTVFFLIVFALSFFSPLKPFSSQPFFNSDKIITLLDKEKN